MTKEQLLNQLNHHTYAMIKPSPIHGIGVYAIRNIPKGTKGVFSNGIGDWIKISKEEVHSLPNHTKNLIETYCLYDEANYFIPDYGFKVVDLVIFLNHDDNPNITSLNHGEDFEAIKDIATGEELLINYGSIVDGEE